MLTDLDAAGSRFQIRSGRASGDLHAVERAEVQNLGGRKVEGHCFFTRK